MKQDVQIPEVFPFKNELEEILLQMVEVIQVQQIYLSEFEADKKARYLLTCFYDITTPNPREDQYNLIKEIQHSFPNFRIRIYTMSHIDTMKKQSNLYVLQHIYFGELVYSSLPNVYKLEDIDFPDFLKSSKEKLQGEALKILEFVRAGEKQLKEECCILPAFNFHQGIELTFRSLEQFYMGKELVSHSIAAHIKFITLFIPEIQKVFSGEKINEHIEILEKAYSDSRYTENFKVSHCDLIQIFALFQKLFHLLNRCFERGFERCLELVNKITQKKPKDTELGICKDDLLQEVVDFLCKNYSIHSIYQLPRIYKEKLSYGFRSQMLDELDTEFSYSLLIIFYKPFSESEDEIGLEISKVFHQKIKVYLILDNLNDVNDKIDWGNSYLECLLQSDYRLYNSDDRLKKYEPYKPSYYPMEYDRIEARWKSSLKRANFLLVLIRDLEEEEDHITIFFIAHHIIKQLSLGLLSLFWLYNPQNKPLAYLLNLCSHFTDIPNKIFKENKFRKAEFMHIINHAPVYMMENCPFQFSYDDTDEVCSVCNSFIDKTEIEAERKLQEIKIASYERAF